MAMIIHFDNHFVGFNMQIKQSVTEMISTISHIVLTEYGVKVVV